MRPAKKFAEIRFGPPKENDPAGTGSIAKVTSPDKETRLSYNNDVAAISAFVNSVEKKPVHGTQAVRK